MNGGTINKFRLHAILIRLPNLIFLAYLQFTFYLLYIRDHSYLDISSYVLGILLPSMIIMAYGNVINDYYDWDSDVSNLKRPSGIGIIEKDTLTKISKLYLVITFFLIGLSLFILSSGYLLLIYFIVLGLLFLYSYVLKRYALVGNITVAGLAVIGVLLPYIYCIIDSDSQILSEELRTFFLFFFGLVFTYTLTREILKDIEDIKGDQASSYRTLPIVIGIRKSKYLIILLSLFNLFLINLWMAFSETDLSIIVLLFAALPSVIFFILYYRDVSISFLSRYTKIQMLIASFILIAYKFI